MFFRTLVTVTARLSQFLVEGAVSILALTRAVAAAAGTHWRKAVYLAVGFAVLMHFYGCSHRDLVELILAAQTHTPSAAASMLAQMVELVGIEAGVETFCRVNASWRPLIRASVRV